jgi:hypothetical protein
MKHKTLVLVAAGLAVTSAWAGMKNPVVGGKEMFSDQEHH